MFKAIHKSTDLGPIGGILVPLGIVISVAIVLLYKKKTDKTKKMAENSVRRFGQITESVK